MIENETWPTTVEQMPRELSREAAECVSSGRQSLCENWFSGNAVQRTQEVLAPEGRLTIARRFQRRESGKSVPHARGTPEVLTRTRQPW
jgi:hypothetical protein